MGKGLEFFDGMGGSEFQEMFDDGQALLVAELDRRVIDDMLGPGQSEPVVLDELGDEDGCGRGRDVERAEAARDGRDRPGAPGGRPEDLVEQFRHRQQG